MKKLNITKDKFTESKYFTTKYGKYLNLEMSTRHPRAMFSSL